LAQSALISSDQQEKLIKQSVMNDPNDLEMGFKEEEIDDD
jgi:hypothetical protein